MKSLEELQVGDVVFVSSTWHKRLSKVERVTKTQIIVDNSKYRRDNGWQIGSDRWNTSYLHVPTEQQIAEIREEAYRKKLLYTVRDFDFRKLPTDKLKQVYDIINNIEQ